MSKGTKIVLSFAAIGFVLPLLLLAFYEITDSPDTTALFYLCPSSIMSMALDHASRSTAVGVWAMIAASNAVLYTIPAILFVIARRLLMST